MKVVKITFALLVAVLAAIFTASASAAAPTVPAWSIQVFPAPTHFKSGEASGIDVYHMFFTNSGSDVTKHGAGQEEIEVTATLPPGTSVKGPVELEPNRWAVVVKTAKQIGEEACSPPVLVGGSETITCKISDSLLPGAEPAKMYPDEEIHMTVHVEVPPCPGSSRSCTLVGSTSIRGGGVALISQQFENLAIESKEEEAKAGFNAFDVEIDGPDGLPIRGSATHPYQFITSFSLNTALAPEQSEFPILPAEGDVKEVEVALPRGFLGNPTATARCTHQQFNTLEGRNESPAGANVLLNDCPADSVVGSIAVQQLDGEGENALANLYPIYNLVPPLGMPAQLGFQVFGLPVYINTRLRSSSDFGVTAYLRNTPEIKRISAGRVTIWGNPADESHDAMRGRCAELGGLCAPEGPLRPFLRLPSSCQDPLLTTMTFEPWLRPGSLARPFSSPAPVACSAPDFSPTIEATPTSSTADSPTGLNFDLHLPQAAHESAEQPGEADLRDATVTLPPGLLVNPSSANGLEACSTGQIGLLTGVGSSPINFNEAPAACPDASKIGKAEVITPLLDHPVPGSVYLAKQGDNPFGSLLAIYLVLEDPQTGIIVKLAGKVTPNEKTGQLSTTFVENPELPVEDFKLEFFKGSRAPLRTPPKCGSYATDASLVPWSAPEGPTALPSSEFSVTGGPNGPCPSGALAPNLTAGLASAAAGTYSPFNLLLTRADATMEFAGLTTIAPTGLTARLAGVPYCPESAIAAAIGRSGIGQGATEHASPSCPSASKVGTVTAGAGAGPSPFFTSGSVYLAGPYRGAPVSLVAVIPAVAGPFDLGTVTDRIALEVNLTSAQVTAVADPLPTILAGIPLDVRDIQVSLGRPNFTLAPTSCDPKSLSATVTGISGATATVSNRFQVGGCNKLNFKPDLKISLKGKTKRSGHPALRAVVTYPKQGSYSNVARAQVGLPHSEFLDQGNLDKVCTQPNLRAGTCPTKSIYGHAKAWTPLLEKPLEGPVYLGVGFGFKLPALVADLNGQIRILLVGKVDTTKHEGIRNTFEAVPDAPVSKFVLEMKGGKKYGLLENSENICRKTQRASVLFTAQNGKTLHTTPALQTSCGKAQKHKAGKPKKHSHK
jgi:hypothetical protein